jgi:hypothetical protein
LPALPSQLLIEAQRDGDDVVRPAVLALTNDALAVLTVAELQVLGTVVEAVAVDVVNGLVRPKRAPEHTCGNETMLRNASLSIRHDEHRIARVNPHPPIAAHLEASLQAARSA